MRWIWMRSCAIFGLDVRLGGPCRGEMDRNGFSMGHMRCNRPCAGAVWLRTRGSKMEVSYILIDYIELAAGFFE